MIDKLHVCCDLEGKGCGKFLSFIFCRSLSFVIVAGARNVSVISSVVFVLSGLVIS